MSIQTQTVNYTANGTGLVGELAYDDAVSGPRPGVIVIHEWWGLNDYVRERAAKLAALGYAAFAIDMYGDGRTGTTPEEAGALMNGVLGDMHSGGARLAAALTTAQAQAQIDAGRVAAIGYCFGGAMALHMARTGMALRAAVSFHGALGSFHAPAPGEVQASVLVCHGAEDKLVPPAEVSAFRAEMDAAKADYELIAYPGALHGFTSREADRNGEKYGLPLGYDADADRASWQAMQDLFSRVF